MKTKSSNHEGHEGSRRKLLHLNSFVSFVVNNESHE